MDEQWEDIVGDHSLWEGYCEWLDELDRESQWTQAHEQGREFWE